jgi:DME family drug/metabolite transporter
MGYLLAVMAAVLWATLGILGKFLYGYDADPLTVVTIRALIAFATLAIILATVNRRSLRIRRQDVPFFALYGLVGVTFNYACYFYALNLTSVTTAVILLYTYPALVALLATLLLKERLDWIKGVVLVLTFAGCFLVAQGYDSTVLKLNLKGVLFGLGAGVTAAIYSLFGKKALQRYDSWTTVCYAFGFGALFLLILRPPQTILSTNYPWQAWMAILAVAWFPTLLAYALFMASMKYIEASKASITATLEPVVASLLAYLFLGETIEWPQLAGVGLVLSGIVGLQFSRQAKRSKWDRRATR